MAALPHTQADDSERRVAPRARTLKRAKILFNNRFSTFDCVVRNISATGALLTIDPSVPLPKAFEIRVGEEEAVRPAKLVYRREMFAGIHFLDAQDDEEAAPSLASAVDSSDGDEPPLRIVAAPLPHSIASRFSWFAEG